MKKMIVRFMCVLCVLCIGMTVSVGAGYYGTQNTDSGAFYLDFETVKDFNAADAGRYGETPYYNYAKNIGANGSENSLRIAPQNVTNEETTVNGFLSASPYLQEGVLYRMSYYAMVKEGAEQVKVVPMFRAVNAGGTVISAGKNTELTDGQTFEEKKPWAVLSNASANVPADGKWQHVEYDFVFADGMFTLGSSSTVDIEFYQKMHLIFRTQGNNDVYVDEVAIEPIVQKIPETDFSYTVGKEVLPENFRVVPTMYSTSPVLGYSATSPAPVVMDKTNGGDITLTSGRGFIKNGGKNGDGVFAAFANTGSRYVGFQGRTDNYNITSLKGNTLYQVSVRAKAPSYVTDNTLEAENTLYVNGGSGEIKTKNEMTNGKIGGKISMSISRDGNYVGAVFTGYYDAEDTYHDLSVGGEEAATLDTEWRDYLGYIYFTQKEAITWADIPYIRVTADGEEAGVFYVDEFSIKPMSSRNLVPNGDAKLTTPGRYINNSTVEVPLVFGTGLGTTASNRASIGNGVLYWFQTVSGPVPMETTVLVEAGKTYELAVRVQTNQTEKGRMDITLSRGENVQYITPQETGTIIGTDYDVYKYTFTPNASVASNGEIGTVLRFVTDGSMYLEEGQSSNSIYYSYIHLSELPKAYIKNLLVDGAEKAGEEMTLTWDASDDNWYRYIVKVKANSALIHAEETDGPYFVYNIPEVAVGRNITYEILMLNEDGTPVSSYVHKTGSVSGWDIRNGAGSGKGAFSATVVHAETEDVQVLVALYDTENRLISLVPQALETEENSTAVSASDEKAVRAKVFAWKLGSVHPLCDALEIQ